MTQMDHYEHIVNSTEDLIDSDINGTWVNGSVVKAVSDECVLVAYASRSAYVRSRLAVDVGLVLFLCIFGLVGNAVSFRVLGIMKGGTTPWLLRSLAVADSLYLFCCLFFQAGVALFTYADKFRETFTLYPHVQRYFYSLASMAQTASVWLVVMVTANRWLAICNPLRAKQTDTNRNAAIAVSLVAIFAIVFNIPTFFELQVLEKPQACSNATQLFTWATELAWNPVYQLVYKSVLCILLRALIPLVILIFLNVRLVRAIRSSASHGGRVTRDTSSTRNRLTRLVVGVVSVFVVCELPDLVYRIMLTIKFHTKTLEIITWAQLIHLGTVVNLMLTLNAAVNFLIYFVVGQTFRQCLRKQCCGIGWYQSVGTSSTKSTAIGSVKSSKHSPADTEFMCQKK